VVGVESGEHLGYLSQNDARAHEVVERDAWWSPWFGTTGRCGCVHVEFALQDVEQVRGDLVVTQVGQSHLQLGAIDGASFIAVEAAEDTLPILYAIPQAGELVEIDLTIPIGVEDVHEKVDGVETKRGLISVDQRGLELACIDLVRLVLVDRVEQLPELGVSTWGWRAG